jgi:glucuronate isomerase
MKAFMDQDFLLETETAKMLYHDYAAKMPVLDYHCHISPQEIAEDRQFENITQVWLGGDHYKWRQMRSNGIEERYITGDAFITMKEKQETTDAHLFVQTITQQAEEIGRLKEQIRQMNLEKGKPASDAYTSGDANVG